MGLSGVARFNNYFQNVDEPWTLFVMTSTNGRMRATGNALVNCISTNTPATDEAFPPNYSYSLRAATEVTGMATNFAGAERGPFAP